MPTSPLAQADPRRTVRVGHVRVSGGARGWVSGQAGDAAPPSKLAWQQRIEDALRCAHFGPPQRVVLLRKLQVRAGSVASPSAPGWSKVIEAACHDALARACHGRSPSAAQADAVWFTDWDDAVAAWLDAVLGGPTQGAGSRAWYWSRIARLAGLAPRGAASAVDTSSTANGADALASARAMWAGWQADPASQRARSAWLAERPAWRALLSPVTQTVTQTATQPRTLSNVPPADAAVSSPATAAARDARGAPHPGSTPPAADEAITLPAAPAEFARRDAERAVLDARADDAASDVPPHDAAAPPSRAASPPISNPARRSAAAASPVSSVVRDEHDAFDESPAAARLRANVPTPPPPASRPVPPHAFAGSALGGAFGGALGWTQLYPTELGGAPLLVNALQRLGYAPALDADAVAASAPWLAVWSRLGRAARERWVRDPMFAALPACDALADVPAHERAEALLMRWQAQPPAVHQQGRRMWRQLQRAAQASGWRSPRALLRRAAWMQLSATHLDVLFALDQADLAVRRLGLDADPGWVPWLGRIVSLHFVPAAELPQP